MLPRPQRMEKCSAVTYLIKALSSKFHAYLDFLSILIQTACVGLNISYFLLTGDAMTNQPQARITAKGGHLKQFLAKLTTVVEFKNTESYDPKVSLI